MPLIRAIGRWGLTWLVVNAIVGSAVFGLPTEYVTLLGRASVLAVVVGGFSTAVIIACTAEVASKIPEPGGSYIYARTVFGRFAGIQVGWFSWAVRLTATAAGASLFVSYLGGLIPSVEHGWPRAVVLTLLLGGLTAGNYVGVRSGLLTPRKLGRRVAQELVSPRNEIWLSPISIWEVLLDAENGRLTIPEDPHRFFETAIAERGYRQAPLTHDVAFESRRLALATEDPADRFSPRPRRSTT